MKKIIVLSFLFFISSSIFAQESGIPFRKANTIILHTDNSDSLNYKQFARQLMKFDYTLDKTNTEFLTITTEYHHLKKRPGWSHSYQYRIEFIDQKIIIKPYLKIGVTMEVWGAKSVDNAIRWHWAKSNGNAMKLAWDDTLLMLWDYCKCQITYKRQ